MKTLLIALLIWTAIGLVAASLYTFFMFRYNMRTASQRQVERETAAIQRQVPNPRQTSCDVAVLVSVTNLCKERARRDARHQARMESLYGTLPVSPYKLDAPEYIDWAVALAETRAELSHPSEQFHQTT
jgi:hypothetical protein